MAIELGRFRRASSAGNSDYANLNDVVLTPRTDDGDGQAGGVLAAASHDASDAASSSASASLVAPHSGSSDLSGVSAASPHPLLAHGGNRAGQSGHDGGGSGNSTDKPRQPDTGCTAQLLAAWNAPTSSVVGTMFNITNTVIGAGILAVPFGAKLVGGIIPLVLVLAIMAFLAEYSIRLMLLASEHAKQNGHECDTYGKLGRAAVGKWGAWVVDLNVVAMNIGSMSSYLVIIGDVVPPLFSHLVSPDFFLAKRSLAILLVSALIAFPLGLPKHISFLRFTSLLSVVCVSAFVLVVAMILPATRDSADDFHVLELNISDGALESLPLFGLAYTCHTTVFPIYAELESPTVPRMTRAVRASMFVCWLLYAVVGIGGYMLFGSATEGDLLINLADGTSPAVQAVRFAFTLSVILTYPIGFHPCRQSITDMCCTRTPLADNPKRHYFVTTALYLVTLTIALALPQLEVVFGLTGATSAVLIAYILPCVFYLRLRPNPPTLRNAWPQYALMAFGAVAGVAGTVEILYSMA